MRPTKRKKRPLDITSRRKLSAHLPALGWLCRKRFGWLDESTQDDLLQSTSEVLLKRSNNIGDEISSGAAWQEINHAMIDALRSLITSANRGLNCKTRTRAILCAIDDAPPAECETASLVENRLLAESLLRILSHKQKHAITLVILGEMSYAEAAAQIGVSKQAVQSTVKLAVSKMREHLDTDLEYCPSYGEKDARVSYWPSASASESIDLRVTPG